MNIIIMRKCVRARNQIKKHLLSYFAMLIIIGSQIIFLPYPTSAEFDENPFWISDLDDDSYCVSWGDYDNDGDLDLAVGNYGPNHIYENIDGMLNTQPIWESQDVEGTEVSQELMWGDVNDDGWLDLVVANGAWGAGYDVVFLNDQGSIPTTPNWISENSDQSAGMDLGDYDNDGDLDLVTSNYNGVECIYENVNGMFTTSPVWESYLFDDGTQDVAFFDIENDGDLDLFFGCSATMDSQDSIANKVYINDPDRPGGQRFRQLPDWISSDELWTTTVKAADVDNDGDTDIIAANGYNNCDLVVMYENMGGSLNPDYTWSIDIYWPYACDIGDVDGDGWFDLAISSYYENTYLVMNNQGSFGIQPSWNSSDSVGSYRCAFGDMNGDGALDLAVANYNTMTSVGNNVVYINRVPKPWIAIDTPLEGEYVSGFVSIQGRAGTDYQAVGNVQVSFDLGESWQAASGTEDWMFEWDTTEHENGLISIWARANVGSFYSDLGKVNVTINNIYPNLIPEIELKEPSSGSTVEGIVEIIGTSFDGDGTVELVEVNIADFGWEAAQGTTNWSVNWDTTSYANGGYTITCRAMDDVGEYSHEESISVTVDNRPNTQPSVKITSPSDGDTVSGTIQIQGSASDVDGGVNSVEISIDGSGWALASGTTSWVYIVDTKDYGDGKHVIYARAKDNENEYSHSKSVTLFVKNIFNSPPEITIIYPSEETVSGEVIIKGSASDNDGDETILYIQVKIDDDWEFVEGTTSWTYTWDTTYLDDGDYTISVRAFDGEEFSEDSLNVGVDNPHKPTLFITSDIPDKVTGTVTIVGSASDSDGIITRVEIKVDSGQWKKVEGTSTWRYSLDTTDLSNNDHTISIRVFDDEGEFYEETITVSVNNPESEFWNLIFILIISLIIIFLILAAVKAKRKRK